MKRYALVGFSKFDTVPACVKTEEGRRFVVNSACYKFLAGAFLHNDFGELDQMQLNIQGVEHDLQRIEQIDLRLYNIKRRYPACNTGSTRTNDNFANFFSSTWRHCQKMLWDKI